MIKAGHCYDHAVVGFEDKIKIRSILYLDIKKKEDPGYILSYVGVVFFAILVA